MKSVPSGFEINKMIRCDEHIDNLRYVGTYGYYLDMVNNIIIKIDDDYFYIIYKDEHDRYYEIS